jgi:hypothetical protein
MQVSRRAALLGATAVGALPVIGCQGNKTSGKLDLLEQLQLDAVLPEEGAIAERGQYAFVHPEIDEKLRIEVKNTRLIPALEQKTLTAEAIEDTESPNYNHLAGKKSADAFTLTAAVLSRMAEANGFTTSFSKALGGGSQAQSRRVAFGLRGCKLKEAASTQLVKEIQIVEADIDHLNMNCVMGVWDRIDGTIAAFPASTVPHVYYMQLYRIYLHLKNGDPPNNGDLSLEFDDVATMKAGVKTDWQTNQLGQGLHMMFKGAHKNCPDLLIQHRTWYGPVLRAKEKLAYRIDDWDKNSKRVIDNIHPTWAFKTVRGKPTPVEFSSAGCNLISGSGFGGVDENKTPYGGHIKTFLDLMQNPNDGKTGGEGDWDNYHYMLLTGREAHQHVDDASASDKTKTRVRFGSSGPKLAEFLTAQLPAYKADVVDRDLHYQIVSWQKSKGLPGDGVVTQTQIDLKPI